MTTLYAGVLTNKPQVNQGGEEPHFEILFRVSYGMTKDQLGQLNSALGRPPFLTRKYTSSDCQVGRSPYERRETDFRAGSILSFHLAPGHGRSRSNVGQPNQLRAHGRRLSEDSPVRGMVCKLQRDGVLIYSSTMNCVGPVSKSFIARKSVRGRTVSIPPSLNSLAWLTRLALDADEYRVICLKALGYLKANPEPRPSPEGNSIANIFRTFSEGGIDVLDLSLGRSFSKASPLKKESASPAQHSPPRTPLLRRSRSMIESRYRTVRNTRAQLQQKSALPLLTRINAVEARAAHSPPCALVLSDRPMHSPRTPILRVKRQKRPPNTSSSASTVLEDTLRANTPASPPPLRNPAAKPILKRKRQTHCPAAACIVAKSIRHLVEEPSRQSARLVLVDGHDAEGVARIRAEVTRRQSERAEHVPVRLVDASRMTSVADLSAVTVDKFTICTV